ncbi:MAG: methyl-accepting chemotaxis protein [Lachnospiraceae bacterium]|nr:methyl-accepting chemotaxis protein [Lachnospiraceae bacterium]MCI9148895.1 methyl-accepting chemotaxis protein [Lachnospiraceae bacterium]
MFQIAKDRKAKEEELVRQEAVLDAMRRAVTCVADSSTGTRAALQEIEENQESLDEALNQAVSMVRRIREDQSAKAKEEEALKQQLQEFCQGLREREQGLAEGMERAWQQRQSLQELAGDSQTGPESVQGLRTWTEQLTEQLNQAQEQIKSMEVQGRSMGVLSLNAAIEAARMGDAGRKFVAASEEVQSCAGEYRQAADQLMQQLLKMQEGLLEVTEQLTQMEALGEKNRAGMEKGWQELDESLKQLARSGQTLGEESAEQEASGLEGRLEEWHRRWEQAAGITAGQEECCKQILQQMETAGESYRKEQKLLGQIREQNEQIKNAIKERNEWG